MDEHTQLAIAARRDEQAFTELYRLYIDQIYGFVVKRVGHREVAEDIVADIFRKVFLHLQKFDESKGSFKNWIYQIATNTIVDYYRVHHNVNKPNMVEIEHAHEIATPELPSDALISSQNRELVQACIRQLPKNQQHIVQLKYFEDYSHQEIAQLLGIKANNVGVIVHRALKKLQPIIEEALTHTQSSYL